MNTTTASCGHTVPASGAPGSPARKQQESEPCARCQMEECKRGTNSPRSTDGKGNGIKITIEGDEQHLHALRSACEMCLRIGLGQFREIAQMHIEKAGEATGKNWYELEQAVERAVKAILMPGMPINASYGIGNKNVNQCAHLCYELWKLLSGGTDGEPLNYSGVPLPKVTIERE